VPNAPVLAAFKGEWSASSREKASKEGEALEGGSFPIHDVEDLKRAVKAYGRAKDKDKVKAHILKRARALKAEDLLPEGWVTVAASGSSPRRSAVTTGRKKVYAEKDPLRGPTPLVASVIPDDPPAEWFSDPRLDRPQPLVITDEGRVYGHIADWKTRHIGLPGNVRAPRSSSNYAFFKTGVLKTAEGKEVPVGQLTLAGGHAPLQADAGAAVKHYDDTASAVADVTVGEDRHGIWVSGALRPTVTRAQIRALRASAPSGDWRPINGALELVAVCQVNVPGFPLARAAVASGAITALVAAGASSLYLARLEELSGMESLKARVASLESIERDRFRQSLRERVASK
jgi:hypothetical protein